MKLSFKLIINIISEKSYLLLPVHLKTTLYVNDKVMSWCCIKQSYEINIVSLTFPDRIVIQKCCNIKIIITL